MLLVIFLTLLGAAAGSFAALVAERLVRGESFVRGRSYCRSCGDTIAARDLVPLYSYAALKGRCRGCQAPIPSILWQAEVAGALLGGAAALMPLDPTRAFLLALWLWSLLALAVADLRWFRLPEPLMATAAALALVMVLAGDGFAYPTLQMRITTALWGAALGGGSFLLLRWGYRALTGREGMGLGDVLLVAVLGFALGLPRLPLVVLLAAGTALLLALVRAKLKGRSLRRLGRIPLGAALALAGAVVAVLPFPYY